MVQRGKFFLYDSIDPALTAGDYEIRANIDLQSEVEGGTESHPVQQQSTHIRVTGPRMKLPPDQALMTYPPANSEGAFEARLPQIVLKRRTLPWERQPDTPGKTIRGQTVAPDTPWLALIIIAEGEGTLVHNRPWQECFTDPTKISGPVDQPEGSYLSVPQSTVDTIFPTIDDISLLTHVRQVNPDDTENAMGDDDGFLAVVIGNRTPLFDEENCKPKAYTACLINLEGQLDVLPPPTPPSDSYSLKDLYISEAAEMLAASAKTGMAVPMTATATPRRLDLADNVAMGDAVRRGEVVFHEGTLVDRVGIGSDGVRVLGRMDAEDFLSGDFATLTGATAEDTYRVAGSFAGFDLPLERLVKETFYRFPVLTSWRFTCTGAGSFQQLMNGLDIGLLGTKAPGGYERALPKCTPARGGDDPGDDTVTVLPLEIAETGHIGLPHLTRTGETGNAWYRGPFSPHELLRNPLADDQPFPVLAHVSDHLRMMTPDGREDVSLAVAFETGRLLAMSQPSFVAALQRWRAEQFGRARARVEKDHSIVANVGLLDRLNVSIRDRAAEVDDWIDKGHIYDVVGGGLFEELDFARETAIAMQIDLVRPGVPIDALKGDVTQTIARGLGLDAGLVAEVAANPALSKTFERLQKVAPKATATTDYQIDGAVTELLNTQLFEGVRIFAEAATGSTKFEAETVQEMEQFETLDDFMLNRLGER